MSLAGFVCKTDSPTQDFSCATSRMPQRSGRMSTAAVSTSGLTKRRQLFMGMAPNVVPE